MRYRAIQEQDRRYPIRLMCRALAVSPARYYAWLERPESSRAKQNRTMLSAIRVIHRESRETYGSPSIWNVLVKQGHRIGEHRVARLMRQDGIRAKTVKKWRATTQSQHPFPVAATPPGSGVYRRSAESGVGRRPHLHLDAGGLALRGGLAGSLLAPSDWLGDGLTLDR